MIEAEIAFLDNVEDLINVSLFFLFTILLLLREFCVWQLRLNYMEFYFILDGGKMHKAHSSVNFE